MVNYIDTCVIMGKVYTSAGHLCIFALKYNKALKIGKGSVEEWKIIWKNAKESPKMTKQYLLHVSYFSMN